MTDIKGTVRNITMYIEYNNGETKTGVLCGEELAKLGAILLNPAVCAKVLNAGLATKAKNMFKKAVQNEQGAQEHPTVVLLGTDGETLAAACYPKGHPPTLL